MEMFDNRTRYHPGGMIGTMVGLENSGRMNMLAKLCTTTNWTIILTLCTGFRHVQWKHPFHNEHVAMLSAEKFQVSMKVLNWDFWRTGTQSSSTMWH